MWRGNLCAYLRALYASKINMCLQFDTVVCLSKTCLDAVVELLHEAFGVPGRVRGR
jgi:hypothetical protein